MPLFRPGVQVQEEGVSVDTRPIVNFVGSGVTATSDPTNNRVNVTINVTDVGYREINDTATLAATDDVVNLLSGDFTLSLPAANTVTPGKKFYFFNEDGSLEPTNAITLDPDGTDTINGFADFDLDVPYGGWILSTDGVDSWIIQ